MAYDSSHDPMQVNFTVKVIRTSADRKGEHWLVVATSRKDGTISGRRFACASAALEFAAGVLSNAGLLTRPNEVSSLRGDFWRAVPWML
jgi:hypothetical protein